MDQNKDGTTLGPDTAVFWSYAHADNELDGGRILALARHLVNEYELLTGQSLRLFVDRKDLEWGHEWRTRIDRALVQSAFFVPVITPRYFARTECRRELLDFSAQARSRGLNELLLPILYVKLDDLTESNSDEAVALTAQSQYVDWTALRLASVDSQEYRIALNALAQRLQELVSSVEETQLQREVSVSESSGPETDLADLLRRAEDLWPTWSEAVQADELRAAQEEAIINTFAERRKKLRKQGRRASEIAATYQQQGMRELPLSREHLEWAETYAAKTIELDPIMEAVIRAGRQNPAMVPMLAELRGKAEDAVRIIEEDAHGSGIYIHDFVKEMPFITPLWRELMRVQSRASRFVNEANATVMHWAVELEETVRLWTEAGRPAAISAAETGALEAAEDEAADI